MAHSSRINRREALIMSLRPSGAGEKATLDGVEYSIWHGSTSQMPDFWTVNLPQEEYRISTVTLSGPGFGGSYPTRGQALAAIADGKALAHAIDYKSRA